jgi:hypothetical protein
MIFRSRCLHENKSSLLKFSIQWCYCWCLFPYSHLYFPGWIFLISFTTWWRGMNFRFVKFLLAADVNYSWNPKWILLKDKTWTSQASYNRCLLSLSDAVLKGHSEVTAAQSQEALLFLCRLLMHNWTFGHLITFRLSIFCLVENSRHLLPHNNSEFLCGRIGHQLQCSVHSGHISDKEF